jgi:phosphatidylinositol alpha-1,6-mannosyltransferase
MRPNPILLSLDYPPNDGGISRLSAGLAEALREAERSPIVVTFAAQGRQGLARPIVAHIEVNRRKGMRDLQIMQAVRHHLDTARSCDVPILATVWNPEATLAMLVGAKRVSILAHGNEVMPYRSGHPKALLRRFVLERAHAVICNSRFTQGLVRDIAPRAHTSVLSPAVDAEAFRPKLDRRAARLSLGLPEQARILLTIARLDPIKGHETVLRAMGQLPPEARRQLYYVIVGKGQMRDSLEVMAAKLSLSEQVFFAGFVGDCDLHKWHAAADVFILASRIDRSRRGMEGFGMALTEAQAAGLPVIGTKSGGIPDAIKDGEGGWLIDEEDTCALAARLSELVAHPEAFWREGTRAAARIQREMTWAGYADRLLDLI